MSAMMTGRIVLAALGAAGCTDLKLIRAQLDDRKASVSKLHASQTGIKANVNSAAQAAQGSARQAQVTADSAAAAAQAGQQSCTATNEKVDRMFEEGLSKQELR